MVLALPASSPAVGQFLADQLLILSGAGNPSTIGANILADTGRANSQGPIPATNRFPAGWWVRDVDKTYIFIRGTENLQQATNYVYWLGGQSTISVGGFPSANYLTDSNDNYLSPIQALDVGQPGTLLTAGHSLGGVFAQHLMLSSRVRNIRSARSAVTFGSPKFLRSNTIDFYVGLDFTRWMNNNDPVPGCPPAVVTNIASFASLYPFDLQNWSACRQGVGGVSMAPDGTTQDLPVPPYGTIDFGASLANWLWNIYQGVNTVHDLPEYQARLANVVTRTMPPESAIVVESGPQRAESLTRQDANRTIDAAVQTIIHTGALQNASALVVPPQRAFIPVKIGAIWWVTFGGHLVAVGPRRKAAGLMCVRGNEFLRRLQRMAGVDGNGLSRLLSDYIASASTPDNGFIPTIARLDD